MAKAKILVVERTPSDSEELRQDLEEMGFHVSVVLSSAEEAFQGVETIRPDLVLMDLELDGEMSGMETAEQIRSQLDTPVIYLVDYACDDKGEEEKARIEALDTYILKPIEKVKLHSTIEGALFRHKMERGLENSEAKLSSVLRSINDAVIVIDANGCIEQMNHVAQDLTGWNHKESVGRSYKDVFKIISEETGEVVEDLVSKTIEKGTLTGMMSHILLASRGDREIPIDYSSIPIRERRGNAIGAILVFRDMSQQRQVLNALARAVVPKLNNILMGMQAHTYLMLTDMYSSHPHFEHLKGIEEYVREAASVTNRLLNPNGAKKYLADLAKDSKTILFAYHDPMIVEEVRPMMEKLGHNVLITGNGKETIDVYKKNQGRVDIVVLDMVFPDMGGGEVYSKIKEIKQDARVLISSGDSADSDVTGLLEQGCRSFIRKPFTAENLSQKIREVLEKMMDGPIDRGSQK